ncbi:hypothetical protein RI578_23970 [Streptomyces sp. BB1-1-1]|uniref:hypothetical protein n=1 Tax=Streptomyces sp. BB1-1-1 TaxID=3074430 RepID=UPI002877E4A0|nr:hypothetical protein [Streptomyces sp. BB1-1-1]WND37155.1 hypothetical protein RI578_23970 [Streptomyces sp. BB1-1-1]
MYGNSAAGPPPSRGAATVITLRVLFAAAGFLTCGLLACVPLFRIAVLRGRGLDWAVAWLSLPASIGCLAVVGSLPEGDRRTDVAMAALILIGAAASAYFLVVDIRLHAAPRQFTGYAPPPGAPAAHYGQTHPAGPYAPTLVPQPPHTPAPQPPHAPAPRPAHPGFQAPRTPIPQAPASPAPVTRTPVPQGPAPTPPPQHPAPARIDQVRAELDELSDYLRKHDGNGTGNGNHEGGR